MRIAVMGTGYVGLVTGACFADLGNQIICADVDDGKIATLKRGEIPIFEPGLTEIVRINAGMGRLEFSTDLEKAVRDSKIIFVAVGTPQGADGEADLSQVIAVAETVGRAMDGYRLVVNKSTVPVGTGDIVGRIIKGSQTEDHPFDIVSNPEFLREGSAVHDFMHPDRVIIGCSNQAAGQMVAELYEPLDAPIVVTDILSAEMIKYTSNAFLALKISFINEIANICDEVGADVKEVVAGMSMDHRINPAFFGAGIGFGGSCFPKDTLALIDIAAKAGYDFRILRSAVAVNDDQPARFVDRIADALGGLAGATVAVWGLSFKSNTDDLRESPALKIVRLLMKKGAGVVAYDPASAERAKAQVPGLVVAENPYDAAAGAQALAVVTDWNMFKEVNLEKLKSIMSRPLIFDGRNIYDPERVRAAGFEYYGVGRL